MTTALTNGTQPHHPDDKHQRTHAHPLDGFTVDPQLPPLCDEPEFAALLHDMVADEAPRLFAIVQEHGQRVDGRIAAWGMAFPDHTEIVSAERGMRMSLKAPDNALRLFTFGPTSTLASYGSPQTRPPTTTTWPPETGAPCQPMACPGCRACSGHYCTPSPTATTPSTLAA